MNDSAAIARSCTKAKTARRDLGKMNTRQRSPAVSEAVAFYSKYRQDRKSPHRETGPRAAFAVATARQGGRPRPDSAFCVGAFARATVRVLAGALVARRRSWGGRHGRETAGDRPRGALSRPRDKNA